MQVERRKPRNEPRCERPDTLESYVHLFLPKAERNESGCWLWTAATDPRTGYGRLVVPGLTTYAHRYAFWLLHSYLPPKGRDVAHCCHVRRCVNPFHLADKSHAENLQERNEHMRAGLDPERCRVCQSANTYRNGKGHLVCRDCRMRYLNAFRQRYRARTGRSYPR
jgi:hypothetical protein